MPADALWAFCMALNIYFAFHTRKFSTVNFRQLAFYYLLVCYGIPLLPAVVFLVLDLCTDAGFYGDATVRINSLLILLLNFIPFQERDPR
jgi:hypothetical protein